MIHRRAHNSGFTLIELLVVISIISLISSAVLSRVMLARDRSRIAAGQEFAAQAGRVSGDELQGSWDLSEGSGSTVKDASGNGNDGTILGTVSWSNDSPDKAGKSLYFDGVGSTVQMPASEKLHPISALSAGAWIKMATTDGPQKIINSTESGGYSIAFGDGNCPGSTLCARVRVGGSYYVAYTPSDIIKIGKWHHVFITYDGETLSLYVDGQKMAKNETPSGPISYSYLNPVCIASEAGGNYCDQGEYLNGNINYVRIYSKSLSASEVQKKYASESQKFYFASK